MSQDTASQMNLKTGLCDEAASNSSMSALHNALLYALKLKGHERSCESLFNGLPPNEQTTLGGMMRALSHVNGLKYRQGELRSIDEIAYPCLVQLKGDDCAWGVIESYDLGHESFRIRIFKGNEGAQSLFWAKALLLEQALPELLSLETELNLENVKANQRNSFSSWLWEEVGVLRSVYRDIIVATLMVNLFALAGPLFVMNVYDRVVPNLAMETLWVLASGLVLVILFELIIKLLRHSFLEQAGKRLDLILSSKLFSRVLNIRMEAFPSSVGSLASQIKEFDSIKQFFTAATMTTVADIPFAIIFLLVIAMVGGSIVTVPIFFALVMLVYGFVMHFPIKHVVDSMQQAAADKNSILVESIAGVETLKSLNAQGRQQGLWEAALVRLSTLTIKAKHMTDSVAIVSAALMQLSTMAVVMVGVYLIEEQALSLGALIACVLLSSRALAPMAQIASLVSQYQQAKSAYQGINALSLQPSETDEFKEGLGIRGKLSSIDIRDLDFSYDAGPKVLKDLSLSLKAGEKVAIIGKIGSGKSSLLKLLQGFGRPDSGQLLVNGIDVQHLDLNELRASIAYVPQEITLFKGSLRDNILMKSPHASQETLLKVVDASGLGELVQSHEMGVDMPIGEHGKGLSGGQRQCVAIARALVSDPDLLLFDELTSSMDNQTEQLIINNIRNLAEDKILLLSTHRASLLALVDRIIVMDQGKVVADGPKATVLDAMKRGLIQAGSQAQTQKEIKS